MNNTTEHSNILLIIFGLDKNPPGVSKVDINFLENVFEKFGSLQKIIIFSKNDLLKAFVEFKTLEEAVFAKTFLHSCHLNDHGRIKIFFSALQKLELSSKYVEYKDFGAQKLKVMSGAKKQIKKYIPETHPEKNKSTELKKHPSVQENKKKQPLVNSKKGLSIISDFTNKSDKENATLNVLNGAQMNVIPEETFNKKDLKMVETLTKSISEITSETGQNDSTSPLKETQEEVESKTETVEKKEKQQVLQSKVILVSNLNDFFFNVNQVFNLFSCFGNITKVILMKNLKKALIEYKKVESAEIAIKCMENKLFGKTRIKVSFSKFSKIELKRNNKSENSQNFNEVIIPSQKMNRMKNSSDQIIRPTNTILATVDKNDQLKLVDMFIAIQLFSKPYRTKILEEDKENENSGLLQVLFRFPSVQEASKVLAQAHNSDIKGHCLNVTFSGISV